MEIVAGMVPVVQHTEFDQSGDRGRDSSSQSVLFKQPIFGYTSLKMLKIPEMTIQ